MPHTVQYAIVGGSHIYDTHVLTAEDTVTYRFGC